MNNKGTQDNNYRVPNKSAAFVQAPRGISKDSASPVKVTGGDLRVGKKG